jgi:hypothetical protein
MLNKERREKMMAGPGIYHGAAEARDTYGDILKGTVGAVTAYLPEDDKFAVFWPHQVLITYDMCEEEFEGLFKLSSMDEIKIIH